MCFCEFVETLSFSTSVTVSCAFGVTRLCYDAVKRSKRPIREVKCRGSSVGSNLSISTFAAPAFLCRDVSLYACMNFVHIRF